MNKPKRSSDYALGEYTKAEGRTSMVVGDVITAVKEEHLWSLEMSPLL